MPELKTERSWFLVIFGLVFFCVGMGFLTLSIIPTLYQSWQMSTWSSAEGMLLDAGVRSSRGKDSTSYQAYAHYRYSVNGKWFDNTRVAIGSGSDNIGRFQQDIGNDLASKRSRNIPVTVWYKPDDPANSILNRDIRWNLLGFKSIFVLVFGGTGGGILFFALKGRQFVDSPEAANSPWLANPKWRNGEIRSDAQAGMYASWGFATVWNTISFPVAAVGFPEVWREKGYIALVMLLFPAIGLALLVWAIKATLEWRRFGKTPLTLDPYPGSIGGDVGGKIRVNTRFPQRTTVSLTLSCVRSYVSGTGKNRKRRESVVWQRDGYATVVPTANGTDLQFRFQLPEGLPSSEKESSDYRFWRLSAHADIEGVDLDRTFILPVFDTATQSQTIRVDSAAVPAASAASGLALDELLPIKRTGSATRIDYPMLHKPLRSLLGLAVGAGFAGAGAFLWAEAAEKGFSVYIMATVFSLAGWGIAIGTIVDAFLSHHVEYDGRRLTVTRSFLGFPAQRQTIEYSQIGSIQSKAGNHTTQGNKHTIEYRVYAVVGPKKLMLANYLDTTVKRDLVVEYFEREFLPRSKKPGPPPASDKHGSDFAFKIPEREAAAVED